MIVFGPVDFAPTDPTGIPLRARHSTLIITAKFTLWLSHRTKRFPNRPFLSQTLLGIHGLLCQHPSPCIVVFKRGILSSVVGR